MKRLTRRATVNMGWVVRVISRFKKWNPLRRELFLKCVSVVFGVGLIAFALKWSTYLDNWYWLPLYPNLLDALFIITAGLLILLWGFSLEGER